MLISFSSIPAIAGDLYLVCEDEDGENHQSVLLDDGKASLLVPTYNGGQVQAAVRASSTEFGFKVEMDIPSHFGNASYRTYPSLEIGSIAYLDDNTYCSIRD